MARDLTDKQRRFVEEYLVDLNATQAYRRAGYRCKTDKVATVEGCRLLANPSVALAIKAAMRARSERTEITQDYVLARLQAVAEKAEGLRPVMLSIKVGEDESGGAPQFVEVEKTVFVPAAAKGAYELLGKHLEMFKEVHEHTGKDGGPIETMNRYETMEPAQRKALIERELERRRVSESGRGAEEVGGPAESDSVH